MSCVTSAWFCVPVDVKRSKEMPKRSNVSRNDAWLTSMTCSGVTPCCSALIVTGVPCTSEPETMSVRSPRMRW